MVELELGTAGLGLTLAASRGCSTTGVFVESVDPHGAAGKDGHILVGDELLEVGVLYCGIPIRVEMGRAERA